VILALSVKDVVRVAVQEAVTMAEPLVGVQVTGLAIAVPLFENVTVPEGPKPELDVLTFAVRVTLAPDAAVVGALTAVVVLAGVMVIATVAGGLAL